MFCAVIVAAGKSRRIGFDKLAAPLAGMPVLCHSVHAFAEAGAGRIIVVCPVERWEALCPWKYAGEVPVQRVDGGDLRQDSVLAGLRALPQEAQWVAVHDAARPLVTPRGILSCLSAAQQSGAAACAHPMVDTLKRADGGGLTLPEAVSRENLWGMETPQIFRAELLLRAYERVVERGALVTDEVSALELLGVATRLVQIGPNMKITLPGDLELAELFCFYRSKLAER